MKTLGITILAALILAVGTASGATKTLTVAMHDPGCHWFLVGGKYLKKDTIRGPISLLNTDEATLKIASRQGIKFVKVGKSIRLARGNYVIMMVGQAVDDNYLKLTVR